MFDEMENGNQAEPTSIDEIELFTDDEEVQEEETLEELEETTEEVEEETTEESEEENQLDFEEMEVKFLKDVKSVKDIPYEERIKLMQLGMNQSRFENNISNMSDIVDKVELVSGLFGMDSAKMFDTLINQYLTNKAETEQRNISDVKREFEQNNKSLQDKALDKFVEKFPDVNTDDLPQEVIEAVKNGGNMINAYEMHLKDQQISEIEKEKGELETKVAELEKQLNVKKQNTKSKKKGVVKKTTDSGIDIEDDFLAGLFSD